MRRLSLLFLIIMLVTAASTFAVVRQSSDTPTAAHGVRVTQVDTRNYPEITTYVAVTDADGTPQAGLTADQFALTEDGAPVAISGFSGGGTPIAAALVLDRSYSMDDGDKIEGALDAAHAFVDAMRPTDQTALIGFSATPVLLNELTSTTADLHRTLDRVRLDDGTALYDAIIAGVDALEGASGRQVLVVLTDGQDCRDLAARNCPADYGSTASLQQAIDYAAAAGLPVYTIGLGSGSAIDQGVLQQIASDTYGDYFYAPDAGELAALYREIAGNVQAEYALTYTSPRPFYDGTRRDIGVQVGDLVSAGAYTERHLINVQSHPLVGVLLLLPLIGLLVLPVYLRRRSAASTTPAAPTPNLAPPPAATPISEQLAGALPAGTVAGTVAGTGSIGVAMPAEAPNYCDQCGKPVRTGAKFCGGCGNRIGGAA